MYQTIETENKEGLIAILPKYSCSLVCWLPDGRALISCDNELIPQEGFPDFPCKVGLYHKDNDTTKKIFPKLS